MLTVVLNQVAMALDMIGNVYSPGTAIRSNLLSKHIDWLTKAISQCGFVFVLTQWLILCRLMKMVGHSCTQVVSSCQCGQIQLAPAVAIDKFGQQQQQQQQQQHWIPNSFGWISSWWRGRYPMMSNQPYPCVEWVLILALHLHLVRWHLSLVANLINTQSICCCCCKKKNSMPLADSVVSVVLGYLNEKRAKRMMFHSPVCFVLAPTYRIH